MTIRALLTAAFLSCASLALAPVSAHALEPVTHEGWTVGLGLGLGHGRIFSPEGESFYAKDGASHTIEVQRSLSPRMRTGVVWQTWLTERSGDNGVQRVRRSMQTVTGSLTFVPGSLDNAWSGFWLRGGAGLAHGRHSTADPDEHGEDVNMVATDQTGLGLQAGAGYEFQVASHLAAGMSIVGNWASYDDAVFDHGWYAPLSLTLHWTF